MPGVRRTTTPQRTMRSALTIHLLHGKLVLSTDTHPVSRAPAHLHTEANMALSIHHSHSPCGMDVAASSPHRAVFAANLAIPLATCCHILPLLPPITPNVT